MRAGHLRRRLGRRNVAGVQGQAKPHRILYVAANPPGTDRLALDRECEALRHELRLTADRDQFEVHAHLVVGVEQLRRALNEHPPTILHFSGHGAGISRTTGAHEGTLRDVRLPRSASIVLEGPHGAQYVGQRALVDLIASLQQVPRLVVLNACYSADVANALCEVVDCVVGVEGAIEDRAACEFTAGFYGALGYLQNSIGTAVKQAKAAMNANGLPGHLVTCHVRNGANADDLYLSREAGTSRRRAVSPPAIAGGPPYDLFLAHPRANRATASALYDLLQPDLRVFLAHRSLSPNDRRGPAVAAAQCNARATVLLISPQADASWYLGDECIAAIALHRAASDVHPIVPVLLAAGTPVPRYFGDLAPIVAAQPGDLVGVAAQLRARLAALPRVAVPWPAPPLDNRASGDHIRLYDRLSELTDAVFEQIAALAMIDRSRFAPHTAPLAQRALDIAQLAAIYPALCQRVSTELDRHAPRR